MRCRAWCSTAWADDGQDVSWQRGAAGMKRRTPASQEALRLVVMVVACIVLAAGCAQISERKRDNTLRETLRTYAKYVRWGYYLEASTFIKRRDEDARPKVAPSDLENIRVTRYEVASQRPLDETGDEILVVAAVDAYSTGSGVVLTQRYDQLWYFDPQTGRWFLDGDLPDLRPR